MALDRVSQPFYDNSVSEYHNKNYRQVLFTSGRAVQCRELTGIGNYATEHIKEIAGLMYKDGSILSGCNVRSIDRTERTTDEDAISGLTTGRLIMNGGKIFVDGFPFDVEFSKFPNYCKNTIPIRLTGSETIYVEILDTVVTAVEDETLLDPASGYDNYQSPGAHRLQRIARYISTAHKDYQTGGNIRVPVVELYDGKIVYEAASSGSSNVSSDNAGDQTNILDLLSQRTFETSGNYLVNGYKVRSAPCPDNTKIGVTVSAGVAYINGYRIETTSPFTGYIDKVMVTSTIENEEKPVEYELDDEGNPIINENGSKKIKRRYKLGMTPVVSVSRVSVPRYGIAPLTYSTAEGNQLTNSAGSINAILNCFSLTTGYSINQSDPENIPPKSGRIDYIQGVDFTFQNNQIVWKDTGNNPSTTGGMQYFVQYLYTPNLEPSSYAIEYASDNEMTMTLPISNGMVTIPESFYNPTIKSVVSVKDGSTLKDNTNYYCSGNTIYVATKDNPNIPVRVERKKDGTAYDAIGVSGAVLNTAKYYSEQGVVYYKAEGLTEANPDFRYRVDNGTIEWIPNKNRPDPGEVYICEVSMPTGMCIEDTSVIVNFTYENLSNVYTNTCHDSYLVINDDVALGRTDAGGNNIQITYEIARARTTTVGLNAKGAISFYHGTILDTNNNLTPVVPASSLPVADIFIKPTTAEYFQITSTDNYRMRMTDIRDMFNRVKNMEYNVAVDDLEKDAESKMPGNNLRGIFTDAFTSVRKADNSLVWSFVKTVDNQAIPLITQGVLSPNYRKATIDLTVNPDTTTAGLYDDVYMLTKNYGVEDWLRQPYGTKIRSAAEGLDLMECFPQFVIDPDNDQFVAEELKDDSLVDTNSSDTINCYVFNGDQAAMITNGTLSLPAVNGGDNSGFVTLQFWMYDESNGSAMPVRFNGNNNTGYGILITKNTFGFNTGAGDNAGIANEEIHGAWRAITFILQNKPTSGFNNELYINGEKQKISFNGQYNIQQAVFGTKIRLSGSFLPAEKSNYWFKGKLANIRLWNRKLSLQEIKDFNSKELVGNEDALVGWWKDPIVDGKVVNSCKNGNAEQTYLQVHEDGGFGTATTKKGIITCETRSFAKMLTGVDQTKAVGLVLKNVMDMTVGSVPENTTSYVTDPTSAAKKATSSSYISQNASIAMDVVGAGGIAAGVYTNTYVASYNADVKYGAAKGGKDTTYNATNIEQTYYEKVTTQENQILGEFVTDVASVTTLRPRVIHVEGAGFLADTDLIEISFDGRPVVLRKTIGWTEAKHGRPSTGAFVDSDRYWRTNDRGEFACEFTIPEGVQIGVREVKLTAPGGINLRQSYWGAGLKAGKLTLTQQNEVVTWEPRTQIIGQVYMNSEGWMLLDGWNCRSRCGTTPLCQTFYVNDSSLTKPLISTIATNSDVFLDSVDLFFRTAGDCPDCIAGFVELTDSGVPRSDSGAGPSRFIGGVQVFPTDSIGMGNTSAGVATIGKNGVVSTTAGDPARGTAVTNIKWNNLVPLKGGKGYGFIVGSTDGNTTMWVASIENNEVNTDIATGTKVIQEPDRGILLSSPNGQTWATYIMEDMKYTFKICNFFADSKLDSAPSSLRPSANFSANGKVAYVEYDEVDVARESADNLTKMNFFMYEVNGQNSNDGSGFIQYQYAYKKDSGDYSEWISFNMGQMIFLDNAIRTIKIRACLYSFNPYSTPILSKYACLTCGQYILPATYTSITSKVGTWNKAEVYIDKFMDPNKSNIDLFISPDQGYTWKKMEMPTELIPVTASSTRYNGEAINQFHYQYNLVVEKPEIVEVSINPGTVGGGANWTPGTNYQVGIALVDVFGNESPLSDLKTFSVTNSTDTVSFKVKFDPNATGYRVYARKETEAVDHLYLYYDSVATTTLKEALPENMNNAVQIKVGAEAARFPSRGWLMIDSEYVEYKNGVELIDSTTGETEFQFTIDRSSAYFRGRTNQHSQHATGAEVLLINDGFSQQDSPTPLVSGIWRFPAAEYDEDFNWYFSFTLKDELEWMREKYTSTLKPDYDEDTPAHYTSDYVTFRVEISDKENATTVDTLDKVPNAGRVMIVCGYENMN